MFSDVSPKPRVQRFRLGASFTGCSDPLSKEETLSAFEERLTSSLPCVLTDECTISDLSCEATESDTVLSVKITSMSTRKVMEQQLMLETAAEYLLHSLVTSQSVCLVADVIAFTVNLAVVDVFIQQLEMSLMDNQIINNLIINNLIICV